MRWNKVAIIGVGLLGGSLGLIIKKRRLAGEVAGFVRRAASVAQCQKLRVVDRATRNLRQAVSGAELIVLCTPLSQMRPLVEKMLPQMKPGAIVTDVGSVKATVVADLESLVASAGGHFVGSHPMAGAEKVGVAWARGDLFENAVCVVTPTKRSNPAATRLVERFWKAVGARVLKLAPETHDALVSRSSHLPHVLAAALASYVLRPDQPKEQPALCANGFRDSTRIASGSPEMWRDIALANRENLSLAINAVLHDLKAFNRALKAGDAGRITKFFEHAKRHRDRWGAKAAWPE